MLKKKKTNRKSETCWVPEDWNRPAWRYRRADRVPIGREQCRWMRKVSRIFGKNGSNCVFVTSWTLAPSVATRSRWARHQLRTCCALPDCHVTCSTTNSKSSSHLTVQFAVVSFSTATKLVRFITSFLKMNFEHVKNVHFFFKPRK